MLSSQRELYIMQQLDANGVVNVAELAKTLDISETTIRRDLEKLEQEGRLTRVYGGAKTTDLLNNENIELTMNEKLIINADVKDMICRKASEKVKDGEVVFIDGGTSLVAMIDYLKNRSITIVTNNLLIAHKYVSGNAKLVVIGGTYLPHYSMNVGISALRQIGDYHFSSCFIGCAGIDLTNNTAYTFEQDTGEIKKVAMANSTKCYLLIDNSKLNNKAFYKLALLSDFDTVLCNEPFKTLNLENMEIVKPSE